MISVKNLETLLQLAVSCREYPACSVRPEDLEDMARELLEYRAKRTEEQVRQLREALKNLRNHWNDPSYNLRRDALVQADAALAATEPKEKA